MESRSSVVNRLAIASAAIVLTAILNMLLSLFVSKSIEGNAAAINLVGSLRMEAYQLLAQSLVVSPPEETHTAMTGLIERYQTRLFDADLTQTIPQSPDHPLVQQYRTVLETWHGLFRPALTSRPDTQVLTADTMAAAETYVLSITRLLSTLEQQTLARIAMLRLIQIISLALAILIISIALPQLRNRLLRPLRKLLGIAQAVSRRDFSQKAELRGSDELAQLGRAFDQMTSDLELAHISQEARVRAQTAQLEKSQAALQLLHDASRGLFGNHDLCEGALPMLQKLEQLLSIGPIYLHLHDKESSQPVKAVTTADPQSPSKNHDGRRLLLPIRMSGLLLGTLEVWYQTDQGLSETDRRLLETLCDQLATAIFLERQITEQQQISLNEERAVIARELHDSLAQSLSYLKIQVARLRRNIQGNQKVFQNAILEELSDGLNSAYRQLRELLATFRLKLDTPDLHSALRTTVEEFSQRLGMPIELNYNLPPQTLSPNEEVHTLHIVREALANSVKHADATNIGVLVEFRSPYIRVLIRDNGKGLPSGGQPLNHFGLIIMADRAKTLNGQIEVSNREEGGVDVILTFVPKTRHSIPAQASNV